MLKLVYQKIIKSITRKRKTNFYLKLISVMILFRDIFNKIKLYKFYIL